MEEIRVADRKELWNCPANQDIADALERISDLMEAQGADRFRVNAYRRAGRSLGNREEDIAELVLSKRDRPERDRSLEDIPHVGKKIASLIREFVRSGRIGLLERLEGEIAPENLFRSVPGVGDELAKRIHETLDIETLEELELAAHDGRLRALDGIGDRRAEAIRNSVESLLNRSGRRRSFQYRKRSGDGEYGSLSKRQAEPGVELVLRVDSEYRQKAGEGRLKKIAPRRFNPEGKAWLPILHAREGKWDVTALFSNTARAHELGKIDDWVVIYFESQGAEWQYTVVSEFLGAMKGRRVVRGRELECRKYYADCP